MENIPVVKEVIIKSPVNRVWDSLTGKNNLKKWYFDIPEFRPEEGAEFQFTGGTETRKYLHLCRITEVKHQKKISYTWEYENTAGSTNVSFELFPEGPDTRVKLIHEGLENLPSDNPDFARNNFEQGWEYLIKTSLKNFVEGHIYE